MKKFLTFLVASLAASASGADRIGTYDSRIVAFAYFWSEAGQQIRKDLGTAISDAQKAGDAQKASAARAAMRTLSESNHLQVFSTAPIDEILSGISYQLDQIKKQADVNLLCSKWDVVSLAKHTSAEQVDLTDEIAAIFKPDERRRQIIADIKTKPPLPLEEARQLLKSGKL